MNETVKPATFIGSSKEDLRNFPKEAREDAGHQIYRVQIGRQPDDWKPMSTIGAGVQEIRIRDAAGAFRVIYVAKFAAAVFVLHAFHKKTQKTSTDDLAIATRRYKELLEMLKQ